MRSNTARLVGKISSSSLILVGKIRPLFTLNAKISIPSLIKVLLKRLLYDGEYDITPAKELQVLETKLKVMSQDVLIRKVPIWQVTNANGGTTIYIGDDYKWQ